MTTARKPITVKPDGTVELRLSPDVWRWFADAVTGPVSKTEADGWRPGLNFMKATESRNLENPDGDIAADAAVVVSGLAILSRRELGGFIADGLAFTAQPRVLDALRAFGDLGVAPYDHDEDSPIDRAKVELVEVVA